MKTIGSVMTAGDSPNKMFYVRVSSPEQVSRASKKQQTKLLKIYLSRLRRFPWNAPKCKAKPINARLLEKIVIKALQKSKQGGKIKRRNRK